MILTNECKKVKKEFKETKEVLKQCSNRYYREISNKKES